MPSWGLDEISERTAGRAMIAENASLAELLPSRRQRRRLSSLVPARSMVASRRKAAPSGAGAIPRVWVLTGDRAGDNSQVLALAESLGWPFAVKRLSLSVPRAWTKTTLGRWLAPWSKPLIGGLQPPWPDLVISSGLRNEIICRWIRRQARGANIRFVHVGRPWTSPANYHLVVTTPQYRLPRRANILHNSTPLHRITGERLASEAALWAPRLRHLPAPYVAVMIGGHSGPYSFDRRAAVRLARQASRLAANLGGSLLISTSARTPAAVVDAVFDSVTVPAYGFRWSPDSGENPYVAFLGLAQAIVVTGDSVSMITEACATGKAVYIFDLAQDRGLTFAVNDDSSSGEDAEAVGGKGILGHLEWAHVRAFLYRLLMRFGPQRLSRDIALVHQELIAAGRAAWLGEPLMGHRLLPPLDSLSRAVGRVQQLFEWPRHEAPLRDEPVAGPAQLRRLA